MQNDLTWSYWVDGLLGTGHFVCALGALVLGPIVLWRRKGDRLHRWLGRIWAVMMSVVIISALSMYEMTGRPNLFHAFAVVSLVTLICALWAIWSYKKTREPSRLITHQYCMVWAYFGLLMAGVWQLAFTFVSAGVFEINIGMLYNVLGAMTFAASIATNIILRRVYPVRPKAKP
ncbi:MAG: DUF2306 domain-containing protein [Maricaulaceae bacterium]